MPIAARSACTAKPERPVTAADVARELVEAGVRAHAVHERQESSVADV